MARKKRSGQQMTPDELLVYNISQRKDYRDERGRLSQHYLDAMDIDRNLINQYRDKVRKINRAYAAQREEMLAKIDSPWQRSIKEMEIGPAYELADMSGQLRSDEEVEFMIRRLSGLSVTQSNIRFRDNYASALQEKGAPAAVVRAIRSMSGKKFYETYFKVNNADLPFFYAIAEADNEEAMNALFRRWQQAGLRINEKAEGVWARARS